MIDNRIDKVWITCQSNIAIAQGLRRSRSTAYAPLRFYTHHVAKKNGLLKSFNAQGITKALSTHNSPNFQTSYLEIAALSDESVNLLTAHQFSFVEAPGSSGIIGSLIKPHRCCDLCTVGLGCFKNSNYR